MRHIILLILASVLLSACATIDKRNREQAFDDDTAAYARAIRWSEFETAEKMRRLEGRQATVTLPDKQIRITRYETLGALTGADENEISITVRISYYHDEVMKEKSLTDQQTWKYDADEKRWYITTALPEFR